MTNYALFINGVHNSVLEKIVAAQSGAPGRTFYLQPYSGSPIRQLQKEPPSPADPVRLYMSATGSLNVVSYVADIIGWEDKTLLEPARKAEVAQAIRRNQPDEVDKKTGEALYNYSNAVGGISVNLISIQSLEQLKEPFSVAKLYKKSDGRPLSTIRTRGGGYSYVWPLTEA